MQDQTISIPITSLDNNELHTLSIRINDLFSDVDADALGIRWYVDDFTANASVFWNSNDKQTVSAKELAIIDGKRFGFYIALRNNVDNCFEYHPEAGLRKDAKKLIDLLNIDGKKLYSESYKIKSASLTKIIKQIDKKWLAKLEDMSAAMWYNFLKPAHTEFEVAVKKLTKDKSENDKIESATNTRKPLEDSLRDLLTFLPLHSKKTKSPELDDLIGELQVAADRF